MNGVNGVNTMNTGLCIDGFGLPDKALTQHIAILGKTGSGKTYTAKGIVERLLTAGRRVCVIDPTDAWWGLRSSAAGDKPGFPVIIVGGEHADIPLPPGSGAACAELVITNTVQVVFSVVGLNVAERCRWFIDFAATLFRGNREPLHLVIDEAHTFAPQGKVPDPQTGQMLHAANQLASGGRSRGVRLMMITQRPAKLHKDSLTCADTLVAMRMMAPQDRGAVKDWIDGCGDPAIGKSVLDSLAGLKRGEGWVWYPEGSVLERRTFPRIATFDSSKTPDDSGRVQQPKRLAEIDLSAITRTMAEAIQTAAENDPKALRKRIAELEEAAANAVDDTSDDGDSADDGRVEELAAALAESERQRAAWEARAREYTLRVGRLREAIEQASTAAGEAFGRLNKADALVHQVDRDADFAHSLALAPRSEPPLPEPLPERAPEPRRIVRTDPAKHGPQGEPTGPQQKALDALAEWAALGVAQPSRVQVGFLAGYTATSGTFRNILTILRTGGNIEYTGGNCVTLTADGKARASAAGKPRTRAELWGRVESRLTGPQAKVFAFLVREAKGQPRSRHDTAAACGYAPTSGTWRNILTSLKSLGIVEYPDHASVKATPLLFPRGLA